MNKEIKTKWIAALRSGEYQQCRGVLSDGNGHCCLGVLCRVMNATGRVDSDFVAFRWGTSIGVFTLPVELQFEVGLLDDEAVTLSRMNDGDEHADAGSIPQHSFDQIANHIEANL